MLFVERLLVERKPALLLLSLQLLLQSAVLRLCLLGPPLQQRNSSIFFSDLNIELTHRNLYRPFRPSAHLCGDALQRALRELGLLLQRKVQVALNGLHFLQPILEPAQLQVLEVSLEIAIYVLHYVR